MAICGAKKRNGEACQKPPIKGKKRCRLHGGNAGAPKGNKNSVKSNIYARFMTDDEIEFSCDVELDSVDAELRLCKVQLKRALEAKAKQEADPQNTLDIDSVVIGDAAPPENGAGGGDKTTYKRKDYDAFIDRTVARISNLTRQRNELIDQRLAIKLKQLEIERIERENGQDDNDEVVIKVVRVGKNGNQSNPD